MAYDVYFTNLGLNNKPPQMEATISPQSGRPRYRTS